MSNEKDVNNETDRVIKRAVARARELDIEKIVVASCSGKTAMKLIGCGLAVMCVTHQVGFHEPGTDEMGAAMRKTLLDGGVELLTTTHFMAGIDRALRMQFGGIYPSEIVATTLRMFGEGTKVCVEISIMATDAGFAAPGRNLVALGGTGKGTDTALVVQPAHSQNFFETRIREVICKPA